ncbi:MAG TPA: M20/M25/M40 family metallo-hydrolase [Longimicrobiales bacterium]|nr:M20/M25/M40 family metallo-hydrolase [Longimicrobiales bacterium]
MIALAALLAVQQALAPAEVRMVEHVDAGAGQAVELLQWSVDINSGTLNREGVRRVAELLIPEFRALGFETRYEPLPDSLERGGHLIAERRGSRGARLLLIGHLDTVFERDSPFQRFELVGAETATGPGVADMKGGNIVILQALRALDAEGALDNTTITVVLTGDEERPGEPVDVARAALVEAARNSDIALGFEGGSRDEEGHLGVIARRSASSWILRVTGTPAHSSGVFSARVGAGAIFEAARILDRFYTELRGEPNLTFNPGLMVGGTEAELGDGRGRAAGKTNVVAEGAIVHGDIRTLTDEQLARTRDRMRAIVADSRPATRAEIVFSDGYPSMPPTAGNRALLERMDEVSRALGMGPVRPFDPGRRGAADISFVARYVDGLDGLGPLGAGSHTVDERVDLPSLHAATRRAAVLIYRLTRSPWEAGG